MVVDTMPCYIQNLNTDEIVTFNVEIPETVTDSYSASYDDQVTRGRSSPFKSYTNSGPRSISFTVMLALDFRRDLVKTVKALRSMYKAAKADVLVPPKVRVKIGKIINVKAVPLNLDVVWGNGYKKKTYRTCEVSFSFDEVEDESSYTQNSSNNYRALYNPEGDSVTVDTIAQSTQNNTEVYIGGTYTVSENMWGYFTSQEALNKKEINKQLHPKVEIEKGNYYVYNLSRGAINVTKDAYVAGSWIYEGEKVNGTRYSEIEEKPIHKKPVIESETINVFNSELLPSTPATTPHLTKKIGEFQGPSGKETYYDKNMKSCVSNMRKKLGYKKSKWPYAEYSDGTKRLGGYIMVAAELKTRPKGSIIKCSLGAAIVVDTGDFVKKDPKQISICVNWTHGKYHWDCRDV